MAGARQPARRFNPASALALAYYNLRRLRFEGAAALVLAAVVLLTSFAVVATPRFLNNVSDDALRTAVRSAAPINRNISIERGMRIQPGSEDVFEGVQREGQDLRGAFSEPIDRMIGEQRYYVDSPNFEVDAMPGQSINSFPRFLRFRYQEGIEDRVTLVEGRMPEPAEPVEVMLEDGSEPVMLPVYEVAITAETSELMMVGTGDLQLLTPNRDDSLNLGVTRDELDYNLIVRISGIIELVEPDSEYWFGDTRLHEPVVIENPDFVLIYSMGLLSPDAYEEFLADTNPSLWNYGWRFFVDPERFDAGDIDQITDDLKTLELQFGASIAARVDEPHLRTGLVRIADTYRGQRQLTISMLSLVVAGMIVVALAVAALLGALISNRRREATLLARSRGASKVQLGWAQALEAMALFTPAALLGLLLATLLISGRAPGYVLPAVILVAAATAGLVVALSMPLFGGDLGRLLSGQAAAARPARHRLVLEGVIVLAAVGGLILFRRRGLEAGSLSNPDQGFDPFLTAVPVLLALAFGIVLLRLYPLAVKLAGWFGSLRRGAVIFVGFRRLVQQPLAARLPLVVMVVATGIAVFGAVLLFSITEGQQNSTWQEVGADYRIESVRQGAPISRLIDLSSVTAIEATADAALKEARLGDVLVARGLVPLLAVDTVDYETVTAGTRADPDFPESMVVTQNIQGIGSDANPVPALVSSDLIAGAPPRVGETVLLEMDRIQFAIIVRGVRDRFPGLNPGQPFIVLPRSSLEAVDPSFDLRTTRRYLRAPDRAHEDLVATLRAQSLGSDIISRPMLFDDLAQAPLVDGVENGFRGTVVLATLYAVFAALAGIALTARERARDLGYLRTLGLSARQATVLTVIEQLPPAVIATGAGALLGFLLVWLVEPGLDLGTFAGTTLPADVLVNRQLLVLVAASELATLLVAIAVYSYLTRRLNLGNVLRLGDRT